MKYIENSFLFIVLHFCFNPSNSEGGCLYLVQCLETTVMLRQDLNMIPQRVPLWEGLGSKPGLRQGPGTGSAISLQLNISGVCDWHHLFQTPTLEAGGVCKLFRGYTWCLERMFDKVLKWNNCGLYRNNLWCCKLTVKKSNEFRNAGSLLILF